MPYGQ
jgi:hypothetical protein